MEKIKIVGYIVLIALVLNLLLFAFRLTGGLIFWMVIFLGAFFVLVVLPALRRYWSNV